jgi:hypothetical protein
MKMLLLVVATVLTTGCSALLQPGPYHRSRYGYGRPSMVASDYAPVGRWDLVMRLPRQTTIDVLTRDGQAHVGWFGGADEQHVRLDVAGAAVQLARVDIVRIDLVDMPGSTTGAVARRAAGGAILGTAGAALLAGIIGGQAWPPPGALLRAGAAGGALAGGEAELARRHPRIVYLAPNMARP